MSTTAKTNQTILHVFDFDETAVHCDHSVDRKSLYRTLILKEYIEPMYGIFQTLLRYKMPVKILTARTHHCIKDIAKIMNCSPDIVYVRRHDVLDADIKRILTNWAEETLFLERVVVNKIKRLNTWAKEYKFVVYYDDMIDDFTSFKYLLSPNVVVLPPIIGVES